MLLDLGVNLSRATVYDSLGSSKQELLAFRSKVAGYEGTNTMGFLTIIVLATLEDESEYELRFDLGV